MPTENEVKYILSMSPSIIADLYQAADSINYITQCYIYDDISSNVRVRHTRINDIDSFTLTYKNNRHGRVIEAESIITKDDFTALKSESIATLSKTRLILNALDGFKWEVDLFYDTDTNSVYFILAEIEMPEGMTEPPHIPPIIQKYMLHAAGYDKGFSSHKLSNKQYAKDLYKTLIGS